MSQQRPRPKTEEAMQALIDHHPQQRLPSPSRSISLFVHSLGLASMAFSFSYLVLNPNPISEAYGWHFQYLTIIGLSLTTLTFTIGTLADLLLSPALFRAKTVFSITSTPMSTLITLLYFSLHLIDPELVVPAELALPLPVDLSFHLNPTVFLLVDLLLLSPPWTITALPAMGVSSLFALGYWFWVEMCYAKNGYYPYPIFDLVGREGRVGLFVGECGGHGDGNCGFEGDAGKVNRGLGAKGKRIS